MIRLYEVQLHGERNKFRDLYGICDVQLSVSRLSKIMKKITLCCKYVRNECNYYLCYTDEYSQSSSLLPNEELSQIHGHKYSQRLVMHYNRCEYLCSVI